MCAYLYSEFENKNSEFSKNVAFGCYYRYTKFQLAGKDTANFIIWY